MSFRTVRAYPLKVPHMAQRQGVTMPEGSKILNVLNQDGKLVLFALVNPDEKKKRTWDVHCFATNGELLASMLEDSERFSGCEYLTSVQRDDLVWHVFVSKKGVLYK